MLFPLGLQANNINIFFIITACETVFCNQKQTETVSIKQV